MHKITSKDISHQKAVRVGCSNYPPVASAYVRLLLENQDRTDIEFSFHDNRAVSFVKQLLNYELDIAFYFRLTSYSHNLQESMAQEGLYYEELATFPAAVSIGEKHPLYHQEVIEMEDLRPYPMLDTSKSGVCSAKILTAYIPVDRDNLVIARGATIRQKLLYEGLAYKLSHLPSIADRDPGLRYIPVQGLSYTIYLLTNPKYPRTTELERFIDLVKEEIAKEQY